MEIFEKYGIVENGKDYAWVDFWKKPWNIILK